MKKTSSSNIQNLADDTAIVAGLPVMQSISGELQKKIESMESCRGKNHPLEQFRSWLEEADLLDDQPVRIQIAGTNGKGSVSKWLSLFFGALGKKVLCFTSPHLLQHFERISLNDKPIDAKTWEEIYDQYAPFFQEKEMTMFEMDLWMALAYARKVHPDVLIMEVGMGGEKDATTALDYNLTLITNIGMDHMAYLGNTKEEIAKAKAGIIKEDTPVFTTEQDLACLEIIEEESAQKETLMEVVKKWTGEWNDKLPDYQAYNFALAKTAFDLFEPRLTRFMNFPALQERFLWPARFMPLRQDPLIILDGAHNLPGIEALCASIQKGEFEQVFFSVLADKQAEAMITALQKKVPRLYLVHFDTYRLADLEALGRQLNLEVISFADMMERLEHTDLNTLICGSLYFAGDVLAAWQKEQLDQTN